MSCLNCDNGNYECIRCSRMLCREHSFTRGSNSRCVNCHILNTIPTRYYLLGSKNVDWIEKSGYDESIWNQIDDIEVREMARSWNPDLGELIWPDGGRGYSYFKQ